MGRNAAFTRQCIVCRARKNKSEFIRAGKDKGGAVRLSDGGANESAGRGAYICKDPECVKKCAAKRGLNRVFKGAVDEAVYKKMEEEWGSGKK